VSRFHAGNTYENTTPAAAATRARAADAAVAALAAREWGVLDLDELAACGLSPAQIMRRRRSERLHLVFPRVYAVGHDGLTPHGRFLAAVKACGVGSAISHISGDFLWALLPWDVDAPIHVTVPTGHTRTIPGIVVHRTRRPFKVLRFDGIPVVTPARALADSASMLPSKTHRRAVREAMARKRITIKEIRDEPQLRRYLADGYTPTRSELEDAVLDLLEQAGFLRPDVGKPLGEYTPDFRWPEHKLIIEADGKEWHDNPLRREDDAARQAHLEASGERLLRVTWNQAISHPKQTLARIQSAGAPRTVQ
jgi:very-short-patch-repair endonuclease